ncbi:unnamed protein product [Pieris brassicae]|uniref:Uncharacterized protein n=1 Tax=Pieris brassicae TaxID=7116 RepID=A0A9P0XKD8_PIEBR|nr:unnamed protein product [Pieris brassicae]
MAGRCLAKRSLVPNDLYGVLHASELKWRGGDGFYMFASDAAPAAEMVGGVRVKGKIRRFRCFPRKPTNIQCYRMVYSHNTIEFIA